MKLPLRNIAVCAELMLPNLEQPPTKCSIVEHSTVHRTWHKNLSKNLTKLLNFYIRSFSFQVWFDFFQLILILVYIVIPRICMRGPTKTLVQLELFQHCLIYLLVFIYL